MKNIFMFLIGLVLCVSSPGFAAEQTENKTSDKEATIGVILPFSSAFKGIAEEQQNAIAIALEEVGNDYRVIYKDGYGDSEHAVKAFEELLQLKQKPVAVISCASWASNALHPLAAANDVFHIAIGSAVLNRTVNQHTVRFTLDSKKEEKQLGMYLEKFQRIAILNMDNGYGNNWAKTIQNNSPQKIVASVPYDPTSKKFAQQIAVIKEKDPDALVLLSAGTAAIIAQQAREAGITAQLVGTRPIQRPQLLDAAEYTNGLVYTYPSYNAKHHFYQTYQNAHNVTPTIFASEAYDAMITLSQAIQAGNTSSRGLFDWYRGRTYAGALGEVTFDENGDATYPYMYKQITDGEFQVAKFQFSMLLQQTNEEINNIFKKMQKSLEVAAGKLSAVGIKGEAATQALQELYEANEHAFDCATINPKGVIAAVAPEKASCILGVDISHQEQIVRLKKTHKPVVSTAIDTIEGFVGFDLQHPVFNQNGEFIGSVSILTKPHFFGSVIKQKVANFPVEIWMMQKDGRIIYDTNAEEIGKNLFTDKLYADFPTLIQVGREMVQSKQGRSHYTFLDKKLKSKVRKELIWNTIELHGTEFRLALSYVADDFE